MPARLPRVPPCVAWLADGELNRGPDHDPRLRGSNVRLSESEQRRWRELEAQLSRDRRLAAQSRRLTTRRAGSELPQRTCHVCVVTVCAGLGAAAAAVLLHSGALAIVSVAILMGALIMLGTLLMTLALRDRRHE